MPATRHSRQQFAEQALRQVKPRRQVTPLMIGGAVAAVLVIVIVAILLRPGGGSPRATGETRGAALPQISEAPVVASPSPTATLRTRQIRAQMGVFQGTDPAAAAAFERWLGYRIRYVVDFSPRESWTDISSPGHLLDQWRGSHYRLVHAVPMLPDSVSNADKLADMRAGAEGQYNAYFEELGRNLVAAGQANAVLRVGWEFNIESWPWGVPQKNAGLYRAFFREIVKSMRSVPGQRFNFNWNVNNAYNPNDGAKYWPGDAYVDSVGVDVYDLDGTVYMKKYHQNCNALCREEKQVRAWEEVIYGGPRGLEFWTDFALTHKKPMTLPEWGLWDKTDDNSGGADNPFFVEQMHAYITAPANNVAMAAYFNPNGDDGLHNVMTSFPAAGKTFKKLFARSR